MPRAIYFILTRVFFVLLLCVLVISCVKNARDNTNNLNNRCNYDYLPKLASDNEPNDSFDEANLVQLGDSWDGTVYDNSEGDHWDYYKIILESADTLVISYSSPTSVMVILMNSTYDWIDNGGGSSGTLQGTVSSGTYFIYVEGMSCEDKDYSMSVTSTSYEEEQNNKDDDKTDDEGDGTGDEEGDFWDDLFGGGGSEGVFGGAEGAEVAVAAGIVGVLGTVGVVSVFIIPKRRAAKVTSKQTIKAKNLYTVKNFAAGMTALSGVINLLTTEQINDLIKRIRKILKKLAKKHEDEKFKLAGKLVKSHININNEKLDKALKRAQKVQRVAKKNNHELILKEAEKVLSKIKEFEER